MAQDVLTNLDLSTLSGATAFPIVNSLRTKHSFQFNSVGLDAADMDVAIQGSNDGVNFETVMGVSGLATLTLPSGDDTNFISGASFTSKFLQLLITPNSVTAGTLSVIEQAVKH